MKKAAASAPDSGEHLARAVSHLIELGQRIRALVELAAPTDANADHPRVVDLSRVLDDVIAGLYTCLLLHGLMRFGPAWLAA